MNEMLGLIVESLEGLWAYQQYTQEGGCPLDNPKDAIIH